MHRRASHWYEQQGLLAQAVDHALAAHDYALAARLIEQASPTLLWQRGELMTLLRWLEQAPREAIRTRPRLCLDLAWALLLGARTDGVEPWLQDAEYALEVATEADTTAAPAGPTAHAGGRALCGEIAAIRAELARRRGEFTAAIALARQALADLAADDRRARSVTTLFLAAAYLARGDAAVATQAYAVAVDLSQAPHTIVMTLFASGRLGLAQALHGQRDALVSGVVTQVPEGRPTVGVLQSPAQAPCHRIAQVDLGLEHFS